MNLLGSLAATLVLLFCGAAMADTSADTEVNYLLEFVEASGCVFHRNGSDHDSADAADHLRLKYRRGGKYVNNADQFIERLASESSWTGKAYTVTCDGVTRPSGEWLQEALDAYRQGAS
ncbi:DUF5329 domain-containing protein [Pseudohalioglobus lutimaris]|uniref:DUF5329 domain-containing protein n=1 Tax=Pseudohalioglobus lutimaris TaxID=1737061 RepID=A0A2N5X0D9_9GAMM|nr:DUF5329 domain-containing protein [Pseudohalioglobus lutimaris]PLW67975.1 hypothetical protein C0039_14465 [Pseudohalioglobus lutimaris]